MEHDDWCVGADAYAGECVPCVRGLLDVEKGRRCHGLVVKIGLEENVYVGNALLCMYAKVVGL